MGHTSGRGARDAGRTSVVARGMRVLAAGLALALLPVAGTIPPLPAYALRAADYPSWDDVKAARANEAAARSLRASLESQLQTLQDEAQRTQDEADAKGEIYAQAQQAFDEQALVTQALLDQTAAAQQKSDDAFMVAAQAVAELSKGGGSADLSLQLFTNPESPDSFLKRLEVGRMLGDVYADIYIEAVELRNTADALADQAEVAQGILDDLKAIAEQAFAEAQAAAQAAAEKLRQTEKDIAEVRARVDYLAGISQQTVASYNEGLVAQWGAGAEGQISAAGWALPVAGYITSQFGMRTNPVSGVYQLHTGVDIGGQGCGAPIRAARGGVVTYAGWNGSWGNYVQIDHGDGTNTGYAHIMPGGIGVSIGQEVGPGQPIARVGKTGQVTGCHLHYIVRQGGVVTDPVPFMRDRGITFG